MDVTNREALYRIVRARDKRYDGRFYCAVKTTGIYCRPICPARPKLENLEFFASASACENAGYRPCLRCRPDLAPHSVQWNGTAALVGRALNLISRGEADELSLGKLAERLGVSDRHLRRLFEEHLGASPVEVAASKRLHLAKQLLSHSSLPVTQVAFAAGFRSVRRFNEAFIERFRVPPSEVRRSLFGGAPDREGFIEIGLPVIAPFDWEQISGFLKGHCMEGIESFDGERYRRGFAKGAIEVGYSADQESLSAKIWVSDPSDLRGVIERVRDVFDARSNPHAHLADLKKTDSVAACYLAELGIRVPGAWDGFETAVCIILGQLVSVEQARAKVTKLIERFGARMPAPVFGECDRIFPSSRVLAQADLREIGITKAREQAIRELSRRVAANDLDLSRASNIEDTRQKLLAIPGIGPWTVEMIAMRCLGDANAFPASDLIIKRALEHHRNPKGDWSPWNAYIALALWKKYARLLSKKSSRRP